MTGYTPHRNLPYPEGADQVAVHTDVQALAMKADTEIEHLQHTALHQAEVIAESKAPPRVPLNLVNMLDTISGSLSASGNVYDHDQNRVTPFLEVQPGQEYTSWAPIAYYRIVWFDSTQTVISGTNTDRIMDNEPHQWVSPPQAAYARLGITVAAEADYRDLEVIFNRGTALANPLDPHDYPPSGYWDDRERPPVTNLGVDSLAFSENGKIESAYVDGAVPERVGNLFNPDNVESGNLSPTGNVFPHDTGLVSEYIPVTPNTDYTLYHVNSVRVVWFDTDLNPISGTDTDYTTPGETTHWVSPDDAAYVRLGLFIFGTETAEHTVFNQGKTLWSPETIVPTGWWDDRELPPVGVDEHRVREVVEALLPQWEPSPPTLTFETIHLGREHALWLSSDGEVLYGRAGSTLIQSTDEWATQQTIHQFPNFVMGVRTLNDGELLVATHRDNTEGTPSVLYKSSGYTRDNPTAATWHEVLSAVSQEANIHNWWGLQIYENIVIVGEYGLRGEEGSRRVWMSEDHGETFVLVFDLKTVNAPGRPEWSQTAHLHTPVWDPYWSRLWVAVGDGANTATYYSDDRGATWIFVEGSNVVQYTGIMPLPNAVIFGSDRNPNGVHVYRRGLKTDMPVIEPLLLVDDEPTLTRVFTLPYKRDWGPTTPTYFTAQPADATSPPSLIVATVDGRKAHQLWEGTRPDSEAELSGNVIAALGPTAQGNIVATMTDDPTAPDGRVMVAPAPAWQRA